MKRYYLMLVMVLMVGVAIGVVGTRAVNAQEPLKSGTVLQRVDVPGAKGMEAILVLREVPAGGESGRHTQSGAEIVYILDGSASVEVAGKSPQNLNAGQTFTTRAGEVHNVKNGSSSAPAKALAFYIAKKGARLEDLSRPAK